MMPDSFIDQHFDLTRRYFLKLGILSVVSSRSLTNSEPILQGRPDKAGVQPDPYFTRPEYFTDVSRGNPTPHSIPISRKREVGLTRDTWKLEIMSDPEHHATLGLEMTRAQGTALDFDTLLKLGTKHAVRFPKLMTCLNLGCPLGMGLWEGVPLRDVVWLTQPKENLRRVFYYGFHNDDPAQLFRSSLPIGRVLEDTFDLPPVILCYKLNGGWLSSERGGPVRIVVPEAYGFKSIKWLSHIMLSNIPAANDTYAEQNNDVDSPLKSFASFLSVPAKAQSGSPILISGYAQVGISGVAKVQVCVEPESKMPDSNDPYFNKSRWLDAKILGPPSKWSGLPGNQVPTGTIGFDASGKPLHWPLRLTNAHWAVALPGLTPGNYSLRCRTVDDRGQAQPMPRPFQKSGRAAIESMNIIVI